MINPDAQSTCSRFFRPEQQQAGATLTQRDVAPSPDYEKLMKDIRVSTVTMQGGRIDFTTGTSSRIICQSRRGGGRISGLSSEASARADVELRGKVDNVVPVEITGKVNPFGRDLFLDVSAKVTDLDLSR